MSMVKAEIAILACSLFAGGACTTDSSKVFDSMDLSPILEKEVLNGFGVPSDRQFYLGYTKVGLPLEAFVRLFTLSSNVVVKLETHDAFGGLVRIKSSGDALAFCQLFTALETRWCFVDRRFYDLKLAEDESEILAVNKATAVALGYNKPKASFSDNLFHVARFVIDDDNHVFLLEEQCRDDGTFERRYVRPVGSFPGIAIPVIE